MITEKLKGIISSNDKIAVKVKNVSSVEGEVDINVRKGKILYFYDLRIVFFWRGNFSLHYNKLLLLNFFVLF